jgi:hypothetical protein
MGVVGVEMGYTQRGVESFVYMWGGTLFISRIYMFYNALNAEFTTKSDNSWLLRQCNDPEFFFNLKGHTDLCAEVVRNDRSNAWLNALYTVVSTTHMCGSTSCIEMVPFLLGSISHSFFWPVVLCGCLMVFVGPSALFLLYRRCAMQRVEQMESVCRYDDRPANRYIDMGHSYEMGSASDLRQRHADIKYL